MCKFHIFQWNTHNASRDFCRCVYDEMVSLSSFALVFSTKTILLPLAKSEQKIKVHHKPCKVERVLALTNKKLKCTNEVTLNVSLIKLCYLLVLNMFALETEEKSKIRVSQRSRNYQTHDQTVDRITVVDFGVISIAIAPVAVVIILIIIVGVVE